MNLPSDTPVSADDLRTVAGANATKSDRIRALARKGYARARIADALGVRYQFVRNVLNSDAQLRAPPEPPREFQETAAPYAAARKSNIFRLTLEPDGALRLPPEIMQALTLRPGGLVISVLEGETFTLLSPFEAGRRAQAMIKPWKPGERMLSEELIEERRAEARREENE